MALSEEAINTIIDEYKKLVAEYQAILQLVDKANPASSLKEYVDKINDDWSILDTYFSSAYPHNVLDLESFSKIIKKALSDSVSAALNPKKDRLSTETFFMSTNGYKAMMLFIQNFNRKYSDPKIQEILTGIEGDVKLFAATVFNKHTKQFITTRDIISLKREIDSAFQVSGASKMAESPLFGNDVNPAEDSLFSPIKEYLDTLKDASNQSADTSSDTNGIISYNGMQFSVAFSNSPYDSILNLFDELSITPLPDQKAIDNFRLNVVYKNFQDSFDDIFSKSNDSMQKYYFDKWKRSTEQKVKNAINLIIDRFSTADPEEKHRMLEYINAHYANSKNKVSINHIWRVDDLDNVLTFVRSLCGEASPTDAQAAFRGLLYLVKKALNGASFSDSDIKDKSSEIFTLINNNQSKITKTITSAGINGDFENVPW